MTAHLYVVVHASLAGRSLLWYRLFVFLFRKRYCKFHTAGEVGPTRQRGERGPTRRLLQQTVGPCRLRCCHCRVQRCALRAVCSGR
jgi:hypothetical protein